MAQINQQSQNMDILEKFIIKIFKIKVLTDLSGFFFPRY